VREVEAVISAWDTKSLILVFFLYASTCYKIRSRTLALSKHLRNLHGRKLSHGDYQQSFEHPRKSLTLAPLQGHRCS
jgi:hypothetical protein